MCDRLGVRTTKKKCEQCQLRVPTCKVTIVEKKSREKRRIICRQ